MEFFFCGLLVLNILYCVFGSLSFILNSGVLYLILTSKKLRNQRFFYFVAMLSFSAWILGPSFAYAGILRAAKLLYPAITPQFQLTQRSCCAVELPLIFGGILHETATLLIALDRLYAVLAPIHYRSNCANTTPRGTTFGAIGLAVVAALCGFIGTDTEKVMDTCNLSNATTTVYFHISQIGLRAVPCWASILVYLGVYCYVKVKPPEVLSKALVEMTPASRHLERRLAKREQTVTKVATTVLLIYTCTTGVGLMIVFLAPDISTNRNVSVMLVQVGGVLIILNTITNVFVYALKHSDLKTVLYAKFFCGAKQSTIEKQKSDHSTTECGHKQSTVVLKDPISCSSIFEAHLLLISSHNQSQITTVNKS